MPTPHAPAGTSPRQLVSPRERGLYGLMLFVGLAVYGKQLHAQVDVWEYAAQAVSEQGFWVRRAELMSSHPLLPKRVAALIEAGVVIPARASWSGATAIAA